MKNKYEKIITLTTELYKENEILKENAQNNDKVVDKINWDNQLLKKENKKYKEVIDKAIEYIKERFYFNEETGEYALLHTFDKCNVKELLDILNEVSK